MRKCLKPLFLFPILALLSAPAQARFFLNVELIYKKGIDQSLTLSNELHSIEPWSEGRTIELQMKNGVKAILNPRFLPIPKEAIGPADRIEVTGQIFGVDGALFKEIKKGEVELSLGERRTLTYETDGGQLIEVILTPGIE